MPSSRDVRVASKSGRDAAERRHHHVLHREVERGVRRVAHPCTDGHRRDLLRRAHVEIPFRSDTIDYANKGSGCTLSSQVLSPQAERAVAAWVRLMGAHSAMTRSFNAHLQTTAGMTVTDFEVLRRLAEEEGGRMRRVDLAPAVGLTPSGITRLLDGLESAGPRVQGALRVGRAGHLRDDHGRRPARAGRRGGHPPHGARGPLRRAVHPGGGRARWSTCSAACRARARPPPPAPARRTDRPRALAAGPQGAGTRRRDFRIARDDREPRERGAALPRTRTAETPDSHPLDAGSPQVNPRQRRTHGGTDRCSQRPARRAGRPGRRDTRGDRRPGRR